MAMHRSFKKKPQHTREQVSWDASENGAFHPDLQPPATGAEPVAGNRFSQDYKQDYAVCNAVWDRMEWVSKDRLSKGFYVLFQHHGCAHLRGRAQRDSRANNSIQSCAILTEAPLRYAARGRVRMAHLPRLGLEVTPGCMAGTRGSTSHKEASIEAYAAVAAPAIALDGATATGSRFTSSNPSMAAPYRLPAPESGPGVHGWIHV